MASLPTVGGDNNAWGTILNTYLGVSLNTDGTMKSAAITSALGYTPINKAGDSGIGALSLGSNAVTAGSAILGTNPASAGAVRIPNQSWIAGRNAANSGDLNVIRVNSANLLEVGAQLFRDGFGSAGPVDGTDSYISLRKQWVNNSGATINAISNFHGYPSGTATGGDQHSGLRIIMEDDTTGSGGTTSVRNKTITGMSRVGTTVTVTATSHGFQNNDRIAIYGVTHTFNAEVNGAWVVANTATNTFDITVAGLSSGSYTSGGTVTNRPLMYGVAVNVNPSLTRGALTGTAANADDCNCFVGYNGGTAKGTDAYYLGHNAGISGSEWITGMTIGASCDYGLRLLQTFASAGINLAGTFTGPGVLMDGTFTVSPIQITGAVTTGPILNITSTVTAGAGINLGCSVTSYGIDFNNGTFTGGLIRLKNNVGIVGRNNAGSADVALVKINTADEFEISTTSRFNGSTTFAASNTFNLGAGANFAMATSTGTKIGTATNQLIAFHNSTPVAQHSSTGETVGFTAGGGTTVTDASTFTGNVGSTAYRISDVVKALKNKGLMAA